jgi:hypothetical protein
MYMPSPPMPSGRAPIVSKVAFLEGSRGCVQEGDGQISGMPMHHAAPSHRP